MMNYLAEAAFTMADLMQILGWVTTFVASVIGAVMIKNARVTSKAAGKA